MILLILFLLLMLISYKSYEYFPFWQMSPPKRNMSYDLRCDPYIPKKNIGPWRQSSINYYHRPKCLVMK